MTTPGKLEVAIKINQLPSEVTTDKNGWKGFRLDCGGRTVVVNLRPRMWTKIEEAAKTWPLWLATINGQMGRSEGTGFHLVEPAVQVFERKAPVPKEPAPAKEPPAEEGGPSPAP